MHDHTSIRYYVPEGVQDPFLMLSLPWIPTGSQIILCILLCLILLCGMYSFH